MKWAKKKNFTFLLSGSRKNETNPLEFELDFSESTIRATVVSGLYSGDPPPPPPPKSGANFKRPSLLRCRSFYNQEISIKMPSHCPSGLLMGQAFLCMRR